MAKNDCPCGLPTPRFSTVEVMSEDEKKRYVDKTRCNECSKVFYIRKPKAATQTAPPANEGEIEELDNPEDDRQPTQPTEQPQEAEPQPVG